VALLVADRAGTGTLEAYRTWLAAEMKPGQRLETVRDPAPRSAADARSRRKIPGAGRAGRGVARGRAVALAASRYLRRHLDAAAMFRCFGAKVGQTLALFFVQFLALGVVACAAGVVVALAGSNCS